MKKVLFFVSLIYFSTVLFAQSDSVYYGVNLSCAEWGSVFPGTYNIQYTYPTTKELDYYQSKGIRLIRLPIKWERIQQTLKGNLDTLELKRLFSFIDNIELRNMKVIVDIHNYCRYNIAGTDNIIGSSAVSVADITDLWTKLALQLKSKSCIWAYGLMNEPHDLFSKTPWVTIAQEIITGIRTTDQTTTILVGGDSWSSALNWLNASDNLKKLVDPYNNLIFEAHCYFDSNGSGGYNATSYDKDGVTVQTGVNRVKPFVNWLAKNHLKGFVGEYGVPYYDTRWLPVLDTFLTYLKANHVGGSYWAGGPWWGNEQLSCEPKNGKDALQMSVLEKYGTNVPETPTELPITENNTFQIAYPNPFKSDVYFGNTENNSLLEIYNSIGLKIFTQTIQSNKSLDLSFLVKGIYFFRINNKQSFMMIKE